jgi:rubrerythrin
VGDGRDGRAQPEDSALRPFVQVVGGAARRFAFFPAIHYPLLQKTLRRYCMDMKEALKTAIKGEIEGRELYKTTAEKTDDKKAKEVFQMLADEEQKHLDSLVEIARDYEEGKDIKVPDLPQPASFEDAESPIFTREFKDHVADKNFEMASLSIGIKLELESEKSYREMAGEAKHDKLKNFFNFLADWEKGHYEYLQQQVGFLESYFSSKWSLFRLG